MGALTHNISGSNGTADIRMLAALIVSSVEDVVKEYERVDATIPALHSTQLGPFDESHLASATLSRAVQIIEAACAQLSCTVASPGHVIINKSNTYQEPVALQIVTSAKIADILLEKPEGLAIDVIAHRAGLDPEKLGRILRMLATRHCFNEVKPNVFANNRLSIQLVSTNPVASYVGHITDEPLKSMVYLNETLTDPKSAFSTEPDDCTFYRVHGTSLFGSFALPTRYKVKERFARAMVGWSEVTGRVPLSNSYAWDNLPVDTVICDIGGGNGHATLGLVKEFPKFKVVLQDLPAVVEQGRKYWKTENIEAIEKGRVQFFEIDFLAQSPVPGCDFYYLRHVLHDWPTKECIKILQNIRKVMRPSNRLLIHELVLQPAMKNSAFSDQVPEPLLSNFGVGHIRRYSQDLTMMNVFNGQERTLQDFMNMGEATGFKFVKLWDSGEEGLIEFCVA